MTAAATTTPATMTKRQGSIPVAGIAGALFCVVLIYLALQIRAGNDPAIGAGHQKAAPQAPRQVLVRRVIITRVIEEDPAPAAGGSAGGSTAVASAPAASAPVSSAPAAAAAAPAPAPPPPAPVVSGGS
jgi:hypothetical protein